MKRLISLLAAVLMITATYAEDGSRLWLRHDTSNYSDTKALKVKVKGCKANNPTLVIAENELRAAGFKGKVTFDIADTKTFNDLAVIDNPDIDCFNIIGSDTDFVITSLSPAGILYGVYNMIRWRSLGADLSDINIFEYPSYRYRVLNHWDNLNGTVERGYAGQSIWKWDELPDSISPRYEEYARACASVGINGSVLNNVNASPKMLSTDVLQKVKTIADVLRPYGIRTYLSINFASPKALGGLPTADPLDSDVQKWWQDKIQEIYTLIPDFGGFLVKANSEGEPGPGDYGRSHAEGANMLADALAPYDGIIMWRAFVYNPSSPDRAKQAYEEFVPLDGQFRDNVIIQIKNGPIDFQPREPFSPLFGSMPNTQQMIEFQITQEYLGASNHLVYLGPLFEETLECDTHKDLGVLSGLTANKKHGHSAIAGVANIGDDTNWCGHIFAQANWYAFGRFAWCVSNDAMDIADEWVRLTFGNDDAMVDEIVLMMMNSREAAINYMMPLGLHHIFAGNHHYGPEPWYAPEGVRADWTPPYYHQADKDGIGFDRTVATGSGATAQYAPQITELLENRCPLEFLLWFHHVGWNDVVDEDQTLWEALCDRYSDGVDRVRKMQITWDNLEGYIDPERFKAVQDKLKIQTHDAQWWKDACLLYFQDLNGLPFPADMERPVYTLDYLKKVHIPLGLYGCPTREMLP